MLILYLNGFIVDEGDYRTNCEVSKFVIFDVFTSSDALGCTASIQHDILFRWKENIGKFLKQKHVPR